MKILIKGCYLLQDGNTAVSRGDVAIQGNRFVQVGQEGKLPAEWQPDRVIDGRTTFVCLALSTATLMQR